MKPVQRNFFTKEKTLIPETEVKRTLPVNLTKQDEFIFEREKLKTFPPVRLLTLSKVIVDTYLTVFKKGAFFREPIIERSSMLTLIQYLYFRFRLLVKGVNRSLDQAIMVVDMGSYAYFHWITEVLPRLFLVKEHLDAKIPVLLPHKFTQIPFIESSLKPLSPELVYFEKNEQLEVKELVYPEKLANHGNYNEDMLQQVRATYREYYADLISHATHTSERIFISRQKAGKRKISNFEAIKEILDRFNFRIVYYEDISFEECIEITGNASVMLGLHGAGLTNMMWMPSESSVIELRLEGDSHNNCFFSLASGLEHSYYYMICPSAGNSSSSDIHATDVMVDPVRFEKMVASAIAGVEV